MKVGIYGGAFNPPHVGHVLAADCFFKEFRLDKLIIIPTGSAPHKAITEDVTPQRRLEFCRGAFPEYEVSDYEVEKGGLSYSVNTLKHFREIYPSDEIYFLCGYDMIATFTQWYKFEDIFTLATVVAMDRGQDGKKPLAEIVENLEIRFNTRIPIMNFTPVPISSTLVRNRIKNGESTEGLLTHKVAEIIKITGSYIEK